MSKPTGITAPIVISLLAVIALGLISCMPCANLKAKRDQDKAVEMNKLLGRGINLGNALDAPKEGEWGVVLKEEYFDIVKKAGFDSVRIPIRWSAHSLDVPPYTIDAEFMKRVDWAVNCAMSRNLPAIINIHHFNELNLDPEGQKAKYMALWGQIAEHFKAQPDILLFELLNEPRTKLTPEVWNALIKESLALVRKSNPNRTILVGSGDNNIIECLKDLDIPKGERNVIVTIHSYDPLELTHQGAAWITRHDANEWMGTKWTGTDAEKKAITDKFDIAASWGKEHNRPINLGEFGAYIKADMDSRARWTKFVADTAIERDMSFHYWEFCANEFGLYDQQKKAFRKPLFDAVLPAKQEVLIYD